MKVLLVGPAPPPYGGMALQAQQLSRFMRRDGVDVAWLASNFALPRGFNAVGRVPGARTVLRAGLIWPKLWAAIQTADVVHVMAASWLFFFVVVVPAVVVGRLQRKRVVLNYRGGQAREFFQRWGWLAAPAFKVADVVSAPSNFLADVIQRRFGVPVSVVPNILDTSAFRYRRRLTVAPKLLVTRHLEKVYDIASVLRAFRRVQESQANASLWIAGTGGEAESLRAMAASWGLGNVRFLGEIPHQDLPALYDQCDIYVNASLVDNFPGALLEASAAGLAVVTTAAGGIPCIYEHGRTALLVNPGDWQGLAAGIQQVLEDPAATVGMIEAALGVAQSCEWKEVRGRLYRAYGWGDAAIAAAAADLDRARCTAH